MGLNFPRKARIIPHPFWLLYVFYIILFAENNCVSFLLKSIDEINQCRTDIWEEKCGTVKL